MTSQPWILYHWLSNGCHQTVLQWSHDLSAMDTAQMDAVLVTFRFGFNGAMTSQPWIHGQPAP